ncbi:MAG TPA: DinB family protein [Gemmatimonadaceae bacterium]|nr:DinB family protein [Gemmatimonadaceae bacterium]
MPSTYSDPPKAGEYAPYYARYTALVPAGDIIATLEREGGEVAALLSSLSAERAEHRYAPGKWSVKEVLGHLTDAERVFAYRALRFARGDETPLAGFDEAAWVPFGDFGKRSLADLVADYRTARESTLALLRGFPDAAMVRGGEASGHHVTVRGLAWIIAGHELHHAKILRERYLA